MRGSHSGALKLGKEFIWYIYFVISRIAIGHDRMSLLSSRVLVGNISCKPNLTSFLSVNIVMLVNVK